MLNIVSQKYFNQFANKCVIMNKFDLIYKFGQVLVWKTFRPLEWKCPYIII